jgi:polyhydroxyalkanoate synthesis regulator phasin
MNDQFELSLICQGNNKRPAKTTNMRRQAASELVSRMIRSGDITADEYDNSIEDIVKATNWNVADGYEIARKLEQLCNWTCDLAIAEQLDQFWSILDSIYNDAEDIWAKENPNEPLFEKGDNVIWRGKVATVLGVYEFRPQRYKIHQDGMSGGPTAFYAVPFEEVSVAF